MKLLLRKFYLIIALLCLITLSRAQFTLSCDSFCILDIQLSTILPNTLYVSIYNGNGGHINYPVVQVVDSNGDTVANILGQFVFFSQSGGTTVVHEIETTLTSIPNSCTVLLTDELWDTTCIFQYPMICNLLAGTTSIGSGTVNIYPIPADKEISIKLNSTFGNGELALIDVAGRVLFTSIFDSNLIQLPTVELTEGIYFVRITFDETEVTFRKVIVKH